MGLALRGMLSVTVPLTCAACECAGASTFSEQSPPVTTGLIDPPGAVSELQATALSAGSVRLDWESPTDSGGLPVIGHLVRRGRQDNMASSDMVSEGFGLAACRVAARPLTCYPSMVGCTGNVGGMLGRLWQGQTLH